MASVEETVARQLRNYPGLFENRTQALHHLFCVLGNGYDWVGGELVAYDDGEPDLSEEEALGLEHYARLVEMWTDSPYGDAAEERVAALREEVERLRSVRSNAETLARTQGSLKGDVYPPSDGIPLAELPEDIRPDWLAAASEIAEVALPLYGSENFQSRTLPAVAKAAYEAEMRGTGSRIVARVRESVSLHAATADATA